LFLTYLPGQSKKQPRQQQTTIVRLVEKPVTVEKPQVTKKQEFEIDQQPTMPEPKVPVESFRKAERDQKVETEQAPKGDDVRDQTNKPSTTAQPKKKKQVNPNKSEQIQHQKLPKQLPAPPTNKIARKIEKNLADLKRRLSRKKQIMPELTEYFSK